MENVQNWKFGKIDADDDDDNDDDDDDDYDDGDDDDDDYDDGDDDDEDYGDDDDDDDGEGSTYQYFFKRLSGIPCMICTQEILVRRIYKKKAVSNPDDDGDDNSRSSWTELVSWKASTQANKHGNLRNWFWVVGSKQTRIDQVHQVEPSPMPLWWICPLLPSPPSVDQTFPDQRNGFRINWRKNFFRSQVPTDSDGHETSLSNFTDIANGCPLILLILPCWYYHVDTTMLILPCWYYHVDTTLLILPCW